MELEGRVMSNTAVKITHCPPGYAVGYREWNSYSPFDDIGVETANISEIRSVFALLKWRKDDRLCRVVKQEKDLASRAYVREMYD